MRLLAPALAASLCFVAAACSKAPQGPSADEAERAISGYLEAKGVCEGTYELRRVRVHKVHGWDGANKGFPVKFGYEAFCDLPYPTSYNGLDNRLDVWLRQDGEGRWTAFLPASMQDMAAKFEAQLKAEIQRAIDESFE